jgi:hypothetical protein
MKMLTSKYLYNTKQSEALIMKHFKIVSIGKNDLGRVKDFFHKIHMKDNKLVYRKQFKIPDAHRPFGRIVGRLAEAWSSSKI